MKIDTEFGGELEVPEVIIHEWEKHKKQYGEIEEFISENIDKYLPDEGELVDKDLAIFLRDFVSDNSPYGGLSPYEGGYFANKQFNFKDGRNKYTILAFGWIDEDGKTDNIHMIGYKE